MPIRLSDNDIEKLLQNRAVNLDVNSPTADVFIAGSGPIGYERTFL